MADGRSILASSTAEQVLALGCGGDGGQPGNIPSIRLRNEKKISHYVLQTDFSTIEINARPDLKRAEKSITGFGIFLQRKEKVQSA